MNKKNIKIIISSVLFSITFFIIGLFLLNNFNYQINNQPDQSLNIVTEKPKIERTTIFFVGDMMLDRGVKSSVIKNFEGDYSKLFENLPELKGADILFANLEGPVSDKGNNVGSKYSFRMEPSVLNAIKEAGFDIVSFANNHVGDWNTSAFSDTLSGLKENNILKTGAGLTKKEAMEPTIIEQNGIRFGFLGFSDVGPNWLEAKNDKMGILLANDPDFNLIIQNAKTKTDFLIVTFHFGEEYKTIHNKRQEILAHTAIDNGADMIIGHHPHVIQDIQTYKDKIIVYSLGNFIFDQHFSRETMRGMIFMATFEGKNLIKTEQKIITLNKKYQPEGIFSLEEIKEKDEEADSSCPKPKENYDDLFLLYLGQENKILDNNYIPKKLREINSEFTTKNNICLIAEARDYFEKMAKKAKEDGYIIKATSGFRNYDYQKNIYNNAINTNEERAKISVAKPGHSEHQLGTAVDITSRSVNYSSATSLFDNSPEDLWLRDNAYLFGFIQSYPQNKEKITGYRYESWHYRYVGLDNAKKIKENNITITEFLN